MDIPFGGEEGEVVVVVPDFFYASGDRRLRDRSARGRLASRFATWWIVQSNFPLAHPLTITYTVSRSADWDVKTFSNGHTDYPRGRAASNRSRRRVWDSVE